MMAMRMLGEGWLHAPLQEAAEPQQYFVRCLGQTVCLSVTAAAAASNHGGACGVSSRDCEFEKQQVNERPSLPTAQDVLEQALCRLLFSLSPPGGGHLKNEAVDEASVRRLLAQCRLMHGSTFLKPGDVAPTAPSTLSVWMGGLKGGKGGFGAMLRQQAKKAGLKPTRNFGACRDLQGRRLRHVNDAIALQKWQEQQKEEEKAKRRKGQGGGENDNRKGNRARMDIDDEDDEGKQEQTPTGIANWYLGVPSWAEGAIVKKSKRKSDAMMKICWDWKAAREGGRKPPEGAPPWWGCPRGRHCEYAHGEEFLKPKALHALKEEQRGEKTQLKRKQADMYVAGSSAEEVTRDMGAAVMQGLAAAEANKKRKVERDDAQLAQLLPVDLQNSGRLELRWAACSWLGLLAGDIELEADGRVEGRSQFGSACVLGLTLQRGKWYYEVTLLTNGIIQMGWADQAFRGNQENGDGIGDDTHSWAFDGTRGKCWNGEAKDYGGGGGGGGWKENDVIGCLLDLDGNKNGEGEMSFTLNGKSMGTAFTFALPELGGDGAAGGGGGGVTDLAATAAAAAVAAATAGKGKGAKAKGKGKDKGKAGAGVSARDQGGAAGAAVAAAAAGQENTTGRGGSAAVSSLANDYAGAAAAVPSGLFPAFSLEFGEAAMVNIGHLPFVCGGGGAPPEGFLAVSEALSPAFARASREELTRYRDEIQTKLEAELEAEARLKSLAEARVRAGAEGAAEGRTVVVEEEEEEEEEEGRGKSKSKGKGKAPTAGGSSSSSSSSSSGAVRGKGKGKEAEKEKEKEKEQEEEKEPQAPLKGPNPDFELSLYETASSMREAEGDAAVKGALIKRGIKSGGTPYERAARLLSLKGLEPGQYPKKLLSK